MSYLLTVREAAGRLRVHPSSVYALIHSGRLKACRVTPRVLRVREADLDAYVGGLAPGAGAAPNGSATQSTEIQAG